MNRLIVILSIFVILNGFAVTPTPPVPKPKATKQNTSTKSAPAKVAPAQCTPSGSVPPTTGPGISNPDFCCKGNIIIIQKAACEKDHYGGFAGLCAPCGNNKCDTEWEDACNCPEDCSLMAAPPSSSSSTSSSSSAKK